MLMYPFSLNLDFHSGVFVPCNNLTCRHLSDMRGMYLDAQATEEGVRHGNPLIYQVHQYDVPSENGQLLVVTSIINPGKVGEEYYMTKGHYHARLDTAEVYLGLRGQGYLLLETKDGAFQALPVARGTVTYIPPYWAHRMVNVGQEAFVFFGVYPADAGHDYGTIEQLGFSQLLVECNGKPTLIPNPHRVHG